MSLVTLDYVVNILFKYSTQYYIILNVNYNSLFFYLKFKV